MHSLRLLFLKRIEDEVKDNRIPTDVLHNWDQTESIPVSSCTMAEEGSKQVSVVLKFYTVEFYIKLNRNLFWHLL